MEYYLIHHGIKGQKWGVRRYRNEDGSRTSKGKERINNVKIKIQNTSSKVKDKYNHLSADKKKKLKIGAATVSALLIAGYGKKKVKELKGVYDKAFFDRIYENGLTGFTYDDLTKLDLY